MAASPQLSGLKAALGGALFLGALSTFGDWLWTHYLEDGAILPGVVHGAVIFLALAAGGASRPAAGPKEIR